MTESITPAPAESRLPRNLEELRRWRWLPLIEIILIILWGLWVGHAYLNMDPNQRPIGREFGMVVHPHYAWTNIDDCGLCFLWDGSANGGIPTFAQLQAPILHPLMFIPTIFWGAINGAKIMLIGSLIMAGLGQWWLARVMGLGSVARVWGAMLVITAGHLGGRMEIGVIGVVLSTAACSLVLAPGLQLAKNGRRRDAIILSIVLALAIVSGQGYMQIGLLFAILPAFIIYLFDDDLKLRPVWKEFILAGILALLLTGVFLIPLLHFWPTFGKDGDPYFAGLQPLEYIPLNFVISDLDFYYTPNLSKLPYPYMNVNFVGWIPIILALLPLYFVRRGEKKQLLFFGLAIFLTLLAASGITLKYVQLIWREFANSIRTATLITGLAVPLIIALASWGLDELLKTNWPVIIFASPHTLTRPRFVLKLSTLLVLAILFMSIRSTYRFSKPWLVTEPIPQENREVMQAAKTESAQWVSPPFGEHYWGPVAAEENIKVTSFVRPYHWRGREQPKPYLQMNHNINTERDNPAFWDRVDGVTILQNPSNQYAYLVNNGNPKPCQATAQGGIIEVTCDSDKLDTLVVEEFSWTGWRVTRDGEPSVLIVGDNLATTALEGKHTYTFRYLPIDVALGLCITLIGLIAVLWLWLRTTKAAMPATLSDTPEEEHIVS